MNRQTEREAFEAWYLGEFYMGDKQCGLEWLSTEPCGGYRYQHPKEQLIAFQAGAAHQRERAKGLVEAVLDVYRNGFSPTRSERVNEALAAFRAAQGEQHE